MVCERAGRSGHLEEKFKDPVGLAEVREEEVGLRGGECGGIKDAGGNSRCPRAPGACALDVVGGVPDYPSLGGGEVGACERPGSLEGKRHERVPVVMVVCVCAELEPASESVVGEF